VEHIEKKSCRVCGASNLLTVLNLGELFLSDFRNDKHKPPIYPLILLMCSKCALVQLKHTVPPKILYTNRYGYKSGVNNTMREELKYIVKESLDQYGRKNSSLTVVDIGANDGTLIKNYPKSFTKIAIEPIKKFSDEARRYTNYVINDFFTYKAYNKIAGSKKADIITAISCFYDIDNPNSFTEDVKRILNDDGIFVIQQNYVISMLKENAFDNIVHEHLEYYSLHSLQFLLNLHDLEVFYVEETPINGGSFRTYIARKGKRKIAKNVYKMLEQEKQIGVDKKNVYLEFSKRINQNKKRLLGFIKQQTKLGKKIYVYGASTRGNTLLQYFDLTSKYIIYAVERNKEKWGKYISSLGIPIISEEEARSRNPDYMLVLPWFFKNEFLQREKNYLKNGGHFIFPLPEFEVI